MKKLSVILSVSLMILLIFSVVGSGVAEERATREECLAKTKQAAKLIKDVGLEKALEKMNDPNGPFNIIGFEAKDLRDVNGKPYFREFFHVANTKGEGFVTYMYPRIPGGAPEPKITYILKVPDTNIIVGAGFFE